MPTRPPSTRNGTNSRADAAAEHPQDLPRGLQGQAAGDNRPGDLQQDDRQPLVVLDPIPHGRDDPLMIQLTKPSSYGMIAPPMTRTLLIMHVVQIAQQWLKRGPPRPPRRSSPDPAPGPGPPTWRCHPNPATSSGRRSVPLRPKIFTAAAARSVGFWMAAIRSAIRRNCSSGSKRPSSAAVKANRRKGLLALLAAAGGVGDVDLHLLDARCQIRRCERRPPGGIAQSRDGLDARAGLLGQVRPLPIRRWPPSSRRSTARQTFRPAKRRSGRWPPAGRAARRRRHSRPCGPSEADQPRSFACKAAKSLGDAVLFEEDLDIGRTRSNCTGNSMWHG